MLNTEAHYQQTTLLVRLLELANLLLITFYTLQNPGENRRKADDRQPLPHSQKLTFFTKSKYRHICKN